MESNGKKKNKKMKFNWKNLLVNIAKVVIGFLMGTIGGATINETTKPKEEKKYEEALRIDTNTTISVDYNGKGLSIFKHVR